MINYHPADAPVSVPFLWDTPYLDLVQWNGIAKNVPLTSDFDIGALGRNVGEVIPVAALDGVAVTLPASVDTPVWLP